MSYSSLPNPWKGIPLVGDLIDAIQTFLTNLVTTIGIRNETADVGARGHIDFHAGAAIALTIADDPGNDEVDVTIGVSVSDTTTNNVSSAAHGFAPKSPADATKFLNGAATPAYAQVKGSDLVLADVTTNDVSTGAHGFIPKLPNDVTKLFRGNGAWLSNEWDYAQIISNSGSITASSEAAATPVITGNSVTYDGSKVKIEFWCPTITLSGGNATYTFVLLRDTTVIGQAAVHRGANATIDIPVKVETFDTPSAGAHTYKVSAFVTSTFNMVVGAGAGGSGALLPAFLRVTRA